MFTVRWVLKLIILWDARAVNVMMIGEKSEILCFRLVFNSFFIYTCKGMAGGNSNRWIKEAPFFLVSARVKPVVFRFRVTVCALARSTCNEHYYAMKIFRTSLRSSRHYPRSKFKLTLSIQFPLIGIDFFKNGYARSHSRAIDRAFVHFVILSREKKIIIITHCTIFIFHSN